MTQCERSLTSAGFFERKKMKRGEATKAKVTRVALELFVEKGIRETTIRDIAQAAGVAEGTLYRHYQSKDQLAEKLFNENYESMARHLSETFRRSPTFEQGLRNAVRFFCASFDRDWVLFSYLLLSQHRYLRHRSDALPSPAKVLREAVKFAMRSGAIPKRDPELLVAMLMGVVLQSAVAKVYGRIESTMGDCADSLGDACWAIVQSGS